MSEATGAVTASSLRPALMVVLSIVVLSAMDALIKGFGPNAAVLQIVWLRYSAGALVALAIFLATGPHRINRQSLKANGLRSVVMIVAASSFFFAITRMPLVEAVTLSFTAPIFMVLIARVILGEPITARAIVGVGLGFAGVLVVAAGGMGANEADGGPTLLPMGIAAALLAAVAYALGIILLRKHSTHDSIPALVFLQAAMAMVIMTPIGIATWSGIGANDLIAFAVIGLLGTIGHILMASGFKHAHAARLAPLEYTNLLWATIFGVLFFSERPALTTFAGATLIIVACVIATRPGRPIFPRRRYAAPED